MKTRVPLHTAQEVRLFFTALLLVVITTSAFSQVQNEVQEKSKMRAFAGVGISFPLNPDDFTNNWKMGNTFGGGLEFPVGDDDVGGVSILGVIETYSFPFDEAGFKEGYNASGPPKQARSAQGPKASLWAISVGARIYTSNSESFFFEFDIGYFSLTRGTVNVTAVDNSRTTANFISKDGVNIKFGLGANISLSDHFDLTLETSYHIAASQKDEPTGYIVFYSTGGSEVERHNTQFLNLKVGVRIK